MLITIEDESKGKNDDRFLMQTGIPENNGWCKEQENDQEEFISIETRFKKAINIINANERQERNKDDMYTEKTEREEMEQRIDSHHHIIALVKPITHRVGIRE